MEREALLIGRGPWADFEERRHKLALQYVREKEVSVSETAYLVGFSDPSTFSRAFKRWAGSSPRVIYSRTSSD